MVTLSNTSFVIPTAAHTLSLPYSSLFALGFLVCFEISLKVINPTSLLFPLITGSFSILFFSRIFSASFNVIPSLTVIIFSEVITSLIGLLLFFSNLKSRLVTIPFKFLFSSIIGIPPIL